MSDRVTFCSNCGQHLKPADSPRPPCPDCGASGRTEMLSWSDELTLMESAALKVKDPNLTGKKKVRQEQFWGAQLSQGTGKWFEKVRVIDRENDLYLETVTDRSTGEVLHHCSEPLSSHHGHGSAKNGASPPSVDPAGNPKD